jgi:hypothetical protein
MKATLAALALIVATSHPALGQSLVGTWKPVEAVVDSGPDRGRHTTDMQPGLLIFTKRHYSLMFVNSFKPRPIPSDSATNEELGLIFIPFTANAGTYQRKDSTLILSPSVAKNPAVMSGRTLTVVVRVKRDTMWARTGGGRAGNVTTTWVRIERP